MDHEAVLPALPERRGQDQPVRDSGPVPVLRVLVARGDGMRAKRAKYPDITFRSMLEGQWTAVLDELGFTWEYEPVHFDLPSGVYVPDILITVPGQTIRFMIEIKGPWPNAREFEVASEVNLYYTPLMFLTGDVPRQANGGTSWWFDSDRRTWSMLRPEEALIRLMWPEPEHRPEELAGWGQALDDARHAELIKVGK